MVMRGRGDNLGDRSHSERLGEILGDKMRLMSGSLWRKRGRKRGYETQGKRERERPCGIKDRLVGRIVRGIEVEKDMDREDVG